MKTRAVETLFECAEVDDEIYILYIWERERVRKVWEIFGRVA